MSLLQFRERARVRRYVKQPIRLLMARAIGDLTVWRDLSKQQIFSFCLLPFILCLLALISFSNTVKVENEAGLWMIAGPYGGDARSIVIDPNNKDVLYVGTNAGQVYRSSDGGASWAIPKPGFNNPGLAVDSIVIDPGNSQRIYVGVHASDDSRGGVFKSEDGGQNWEELRDISGQSVRSLAMALNNSNVLVAGTISGVFRTEDGGQTWQRISPFGHAEIKNVQSVAVDPRDSNIIYAGTFHLPWKTTDGGRNWFSIKTGIIDDSDIFAIEIDRTNNDHVYASACSGIYETYDAGANWKKINGIPFTSRRTRDILQNPGNPSVVFAGTTEGLWRTVDSGQSWALMTSKKLVINAVAVHPNSPDTVYLATDDAGIMVSKDGGLSFVATNTGFANRQIATVLADASKPDRILIGLLHDNIHGGIYLSDDAGKSWRQSIRGMGVRDVFTLYQSPDRPGTIYAGTNYGVYRSDDQGESWTRVEKKKGPRTAPRKRRADAETRRRGDALADAEAKTSYVGTSERPTSVLRPTSVRPTSDGRNVRRRTYRRRTYIGRRTSDGDQQFAIAKVRYLQAEPQSRSRSSAKQKNKAQAPGATSRSRSKTIVEKGPQLVDLNVPVLEITSTNDGKDGLLAAAWNGLYRTYDGSKGWEKIRITGYDGRVMTVATSKNAPQTIYAGTLRGLFLSRDGGKEWQQLSLDPDAQDAIIQSLLIDPGNPEIVYACTRGAFYLSSDGGKSWNRRGGGMPYGDYSVVRVNPKNSEIIVGEQMHGGIYRSVDKGASWRRIDSNLPSARIWAVTFDPFNDDRAFIGSFAGGVYVLSRSPLASAGSNQ